MDFGIFKTYGAHNSPPVFNAFCQGLNQLGLKWSDSDYSADVAVIWSVVWAGRMHANINVWQQFRMSKRPVVVLEVGMLHRGHTWKMGVNGTGGDAYWGQGIDAARPEKLDIQLKPWQTTGNNIVIAVQRHDSEQWLHQPDINQWTANTVRRIQKVSDRPIVLRKHPRQQISIPTGCTLDTPKQLFGTYDTFDFTNALSNAWAVVNWNSGPGSQAIINGVPAFVGSSSLAAPVGNLDVTNIEKPLRPDRSQWLVNICHTEWTIDEIASGYPMSRLLPGLQSN